MTRILFGLSLLLATCLIDSGGIAAGNAGLSDSILVQGIDGDSTDSIENDSGDDIALPFVTTLQFLSLPASLHAARTCAQYATARRCYLIRAPPLPYLPV